MSVLLNLIRKTSTTVKRMENARRKGFETELLRENIAAQVDRLLTQLEDLEELKDGKLLLCQAPDSMQSAYLGFYFGYR